MKASSVSGDGWDAWRDKADTVLYACGRKALMKETKYTSRLSTAEELGPTSMRHPRSHTNFGTSAASCLE